MRLTLNRLRGAGAFALTAGALLGGAAAQAEPPAEPPPPPHCSAADLAGIASGVAASTSAYLFTHPELNAFFTDLHGQPQDEVPESTRVYFDAHPQEHAELRGIRQPLVDFRTRCGYNAPNPPGGQQ
ncbi:heme-binding protein [Mycolicibacterium frederiksbergense]|uniref:Hemophore-related protein n=1 Tax=Mycolicibacterium frederiksbergense TaxID=117567 RepID=A0A6H0S7T2_9MYCO|nr:heme-binding protein [Mycolicibacterium frederiksbergense]QIV82405.1 hemophore-related protein [Mycolicibacterium frederiksbergense]